VWCEMSDGETARWRVAPIKTIMTSNLLHSFALLIAKNYGTACSGNVPTNAISSRQRFARREQSRNDTSPLRWPG
jgi:hypothetical protein